MISFNDALLKELFPNVEIEAGKDIDISKYAYEDEIDTSKKTLVVDWYYKKNGKLHYCKFANETVIFATENV